MMRTTTVRALLLAGSLGSFGAGAPIGFGASALAGLGVTALWSTSAHAVDSATRGAARDLATEGVGDYQAGNYQVASEKLERAYKVLPLPSLALWSARALDKCGKLVEASERYLEATRLEAGGGDQAVQEQAKEEARTERAALLPRLSSLTIEIVGATPENVVVTIEGTPIDSALLGVPRPTNPGKVAVRAEAGSTVAAVTVTLTEGEKRSVRLTLEKTTPGQQPATAASAPAAGAHDDGAASSNQWQRPVGWVGVGLGAVGLIVGGVAAVVAADQQSSLDCPGGSCPPGTDPGAIDSYNSMRVISSIGFIAGGVLAAGGVTLLLTAPRPASKSASVRPYLGWASVGVRGQF